MVLLIVLNMRVFSFQATNCITFMPLKGLNSAFSNALSALCPGNFSSQAFAAANSPVLWVS